MGKAKLIKSTGSSKSNPQGHWYIHDEIKPFIQGIEAGDLDENQVNSTLISGVPSPWARPKLFWFAFDYKKNEDANITTSGLFGFYKTLIDEWKGLMATIALFPDRVSFSDPIELDDKGELYDIPSAFGRMLLDEKEYWIDQEKKEINPQEKPFIQLIKYNDQVIGGTSPFSIFFPGVEYVGLKNTTDLPWYTGGKFTDPMPYLRNDIDKVQKLYLFIKNINTNFEAYMKMQEKVESNINHVYHPDLQGLQRFLMNWQRELHNRFKLQDNGTVAKYSNLCNPYAALLVSNQKVYLLKTGDLTFIKPEDETMIVKVLSDLQNVLKEGKKIVGWYESSDYTQPLSKSAVYYLKVNDLRDRENQVKYFALPLSIEGLQMFSKKLGVLVSQNDPNFTIEGKISDSGKLIVDLTVTIDKQPYKLNSKEYDIEWADNGKKVIVWPNFISDKWDAYYLYSEFPSNLSGMKFVSFYKHCIDGQIITVDRPEGASVVQKIVYSDSVDDMKDDAELNVNKLVEYPLNMASEDKHKYEVIKSNCPIAGLEIRIESAGRSETAGYLMVKNPVDESMGEHKIMDYTTQNVNQNAAVGIDFGSNNSCVYYTTNTGTYPVTFENRRLALVGIESPSGSIAEMDELLFFSNEPSGNGQIKSWLHEHDDRFIGANRGKEIAGGVAVNERNIRIKTMNRQIIETQAGVLHYNMKWLSDTKGISQKTAFLKAIWLSVCADLYAKQLAPNEIRWSYPSSMTPTDWNQYNNIYSAQLPNITPILDDQHNRIVVKPKNITHLTESEAVCKYALSQEIGLNGIMFMGIDVGGSTSDILLLARNSNTNNDPTLFSQSSVRIAAGVFFDAVISSQLFRKAIYDFHQSQKTIHVENIKDILSNGEKAPFYLNSVFDQLTPDNSSEFYSWISREASFVYAIPAYVTGLLVFYAGKLCAKTIRENNLTTIKRVDLMPFGKGGRLFHWLQTNPGEGPTTQFYQECFRKAYGEGSENITLVYRDDVVKDNKSEVSMGLVSNQTLVFDPNIRDKSDIFGEKGIKYLNNGQEDVLDENQVVLSEYFENVDSFTFPSELENFDVFLEIFIDFVSQKAGLVRDVAALKNRKGELYTRLSSFITNDSEYKKARDNKQQTGTFEYRFPIFVAEGLCYLEKILIPEVFKS